MKSFNLKNPMLAAAASVAVLGGGARSAQATDAIPVLLCPFGCGPMAGDTILMNQLIQSGSGVMLLPQEYIGFAAFGYTSNSSEHYSNFILGVVVMTGLLAVRNLCDEKLGIPDPETDMLRPVRPYFWGRFAFAAVALIMATIAMGYVRLNAVHFEVSQPFFNKTDMVFGWLMTISILMLTFIHWGRLLTSVVSAAIAYFFLGYKIENPLFMTPQYSNEFVMIYIGLGTNQGFYYLAQVAADAIYFLIIYAAILLGVGMLDMVLEAGKATGRRVPGGAAGPAQRRVGCHRMTSPETVHPQKGRRFGST